MYTILIHLSVLSLLEIIFYFNYVGPLESKLFKESFSSPSTPENNFNPIYINRTIEYNSNNITDYYQERSDQAEDNRHAYNTDLYHRTIVYWILLLTITVVITIFELVYKDYKKNLKKDNHHQLEEIEMIELNNNSTEENSILLHNQINNDSNKINYIKICKKLFYYVMLFGFILAFEYLFFQYIILNYHIISKQELELLIIETYLPLINNYIISDMINF
tara:strand:+ start:213 stop:872 length:660 start_codon:yes stop_codon:yes gene_type:complete